LKRQLTSHPFTGAGESGKSTIFKQLRIIHSNGFTKKELAIFSPIIRRNVIDGLRRVLVILLAQHIELEDPSLLDIVQKIVERTVMIDNASIVSRLWTDRGVQVAFVEACRYHSLESLEWFIDRIDYIFDSNYLPTVGDMLRARARTTGAQRMTIQLKSKAVTLIDVGGQRSERKTWAQSFQNVTAIIFVASLAEYDQLCVEDVTQNRMKENLLLFGEICSLHCFANVPLILFLNKTDVFRSKIERKDLRMCFPDYTGGNDFFHASKFIRERFEEYPNRQHRQIFTHFTSATDTDSVNRVFHDIESIILLENMVSAGFL
jgi:GTPase SAR1 family protein